MNRDKKMLEKRADFVKKTLKESKKSACATVQALSKRLYLTERTIWKDLKK